MASVVEIVGALLVLGAATFAIARFRPARIVSVDFEIPNPLILDQQCRAIRRLLIEAPDLRWVDLTLGDGFIADRTSIHTLEQLQAMLSGTRVVLSITASPTVAATLAARGLSAAATSDRFSVAEVA